MGRDTEPARRPQPRQTWLAGRGQVGRGAPFGPLRLRDRLGLGTPGGGAGGVDAGRGFTALSAVAAVLAGRATRSDECTRPCDSTITGPVQRAGPLPARWPVPAPNSDGSGSRRGRGGAAAPGARRCGRCGSTPSPPHSGPARSGRRPRADCRPPRSFTGGGFATEVVGGGPAVAVVPLGELIESLANDASPADNAPNTLYVSPGSAIACVA